jgi:ATP-dependent DNA ligase
MLLDLPKARSVCVRIELISPSIKPKVVRCRIREPSCSQIKFTEWTPNGHLRHSKFIGLREDKEAIEVVVREG